MIEIRRSNERGHFDFGWLDTYHSFSFGEYHDSRFMGFRALRVLNDDRIAPGQGFPTHSHRDMEIISYVSAGTLSHKDSMGNGSDIRVGEIQYMSAGSGVTHSEFNHSQREGVHLIQMWVLPDVQGAEPRYGQQPTDLFQKKNQIRLLCSKDGRDGSIAIRQSTSLYGLVLEKNQTVEHRLQWGGYGYIHIVKGEVLFRDDQLSSGDAAFLSRESSFQIKGAAAETEVLIFDLA